MSVSASYVTIQGVTPARKEMPEGLEIEVDIVVFSYKGIRFSIETEPGRCLVGDEVAIQVTYRDSLGNPRIICLV